MTPSRSEKGYLKLIIGCMFAGKTDYLICQINAFERQNIPVLKFKPSADTRAKNQFYSRTGKKVTAISVSDVQTIWPTILKHEKIIKRPVNLIAFDEVHFFGLDLIPVIQKILKHSKTILCSGLEKGFSERQLPIVDWLKTVAHEIIFFKAKCFLCGQEATKTQRINAQKQPVSPTQISCDNLVGNDEIYQARCNQCYKKLS